MKKLINYILEILNNYEDDVTFTQRTLKEIK
jgi:hypothetical protein